MVKFLLGSLLTVLIVSACFGPIPATFMFCTIASAHRFQSPLRILRGQRCSRFFLRCLGVNGPTWDVEYDWHNLCTDLQRNAGYI